MESVTIKVEESLLKRIDTSMKEHCYSTKTEFIREAIRDKLDVDEKEQLLKKFMNLRGQSKVKTTVEQNRISRDEVASKLAKEYGVEL